VLEVTLENQPDERRNQFRIDRALVGTPDSDRITLLNESGSLCGFWLDDVALGSRYLVFVSPWRRAEGESTLFACADNRSIYRLNRQGTEIEYGFTTRASGTRNAGLRFQPYNPAALLNGCGLPGPKGGSQDSPLQRLWLSNNPGNGQTALSVTAGEFPNLRELEVYRADGRRLSRIPLTDYGAGTPLPLGELPNGYHLLVITDGVYRKTLPYVKL
jgi:hypothetical protein